MMTRKEYYEFLKMNGGLVYRNRDLPYPIEIFGTECDDGWLEMIAELIRELIDAGWTREIRQIKEKFGGLCFYAGGMNKDLMEFIRKYENRSYYICERCSTENNVKLRGHDWVKTLCDSCAVKWLNRKKF